MSPDQLHGILLDIEGTTSSISFVYDEMFPFVREHLDAFLTREWGDVQVQAACEQIARDRGADSLAAWRQSEQADDDQAARLLIKAEVIRLMDGDVKATGLKQLQGLIWKDGFESGELIAHVYDDVPPALKRWKDAGLDVRVYSSGSVAAQKLFFAHTAHGDLLGYFNGHYDTTTGSKKEASSYRKIAEAFGERAERILFISDSIAELDAAREAGMQTRLSIRPGNATVEDDGGHVRAESFDTIG